MTMLSAAEFRDRQAAAMLEAALQSQVEQQARALGWLAYHTHDSRRSAAGFPDLVLVHARQSRVLYRELKRQTGRLSRDQQEWLAALTAAGADVGVWRPSDLFSGLITDQPARPP